MNRVKTHPIVEIKERKKIRFYFEGKEMFAFEGEVISSALFANGIKIFGYHKKDNAPQGIFCANGQCSQCSVIAWGKVVKACITKVKEDMEIYAIKGVASIDFEEKTIKNNYSKIEEIETDVIVVGGGPSGLSAAIELGKFNLDVLVVDDKDKPGGKLVLQTHKFFGSVDDCYAGMRGIEIADKLASDISKYPSIKIWLESTVFGVFSDKKIGVIKNGVCYLIKPKLAIFATGAREKTLLFEGNTLPGIYGAGAFQTLVNRDLVKASDRIFIVGGGNVGLIAAYHAIQANIKVVGLCEVSEKCGGYKVHEDKIKRLGVKVYTSHTILKAEGKDCVERVIICEVDKNYNPIPGREKVFNVDTILIACGLNPVNELYHQAVDYQIPSFICGDAEEIAEASAAMFSGKIAAHKALKYLGFVTNEVPGFWFEKLNILKSRPGNIKKREINYNKQLRIYPVIHCNQEIPCNPCVTVCPKKSIKLEEKSITSLPYFEGECIGCFKCLLICPGLAITIVDKRKDISPIVWVPMEIDVAIEKGEKVIAVDIEGRYLGECEVVEKRNFKAEKTIAIGIKADDAYADKIASLKILDDEFFIKHSSELKFMSDDIIVCRCERVKLGEIRKWIRKGVKDLNQLKAITRVGMGSCGAKTCGQLLLNIMRSEGVKLDEVTDLTKRPLFVEIDFGSFAGLNKKEDKINDNFSNF
ncbi:MAG: FAD-dependent oxidoreductase [Elusimicrobiota bacterium]